jgi:hypothetical protein
LNNLCFFNGCYDITEGRWKSLEKISSFACKDAKILKMGNQQSTKCFALLDLEKDDHLQKWTTHRQNMMATRMKPWYKRLGDRKIPSTKFALYQQYLLTCICKEDKRNRLKEDEVAAVYDNEVVHVNL